MANLGTWTIDTDGEYQTLASITELTFTEGNTYTLQVLNSAFVREGEDGKGFQIDNSNPFDWVAGTDDLYIKNLYCPVTINIAGEISE